jgi:hypothetical protein
MLQLALIVALLSAAVNAGPCANPEDPGCCLQFASVPHQNGTMLSIPLDYDANSKTVN